MMFSTIAILPGRYERGDDGRLIEVEPARPCPELMTAEEAIRLLRHSRLLMTPMNPGTGK